MTTRRHLLNTAVALMAASATPAGAAAARRPPPFRTALLELRSYGCAPGRREALIAMFEDSFLDAYVAGGTAIVGTFRDLDDTDRWVWLRGFASAAARGPALQAFYGSAPWKQRAGAANATIDDIRPALLLQPTVDDGLDAEVPTAQAAAPHTRVLIEIYPLRQQAVGRFEAKFAGSALQVLRELGAAPLARLRSDRNANSFPRQPVREDFTVVTLTRFANEAAMGAALTARATSAAWQARVWPALAALLAGPPETYRLQPTRRSVLQ